MDYTEILSLIIKLIVAIVSAMLVPYLKSKYSAAQLDKALAYVDIFVAAAEQLYDVTQGELKKEYVLKQLAAKGFKINSGVIDAQIEAAVLRLHSEIRSEANEQGKE